NRIQFGRAIGSFQAIQHRAADMHLKAEQAAALVRFAFWCLENDRRQFLLTANAAKGYASEVVPWIAEQAIQCHGGRGMSSDSGLHLYLRRARVLALSCKTERECYTELANMLLAQP
ncbi:MAG TPA: acyl-CoA dehydrogenase family protein, partial [Oligoflexia bacterium]|nr:acyl-CoA dehydrogenase family protein [Oligoflexia bacterium]